MNATGIEVSKFLGGLVESFDRLNQPLGFIYKNELRDYVVVKNVFFYIGYSLAEDGCTFRILSAGEIDLHMALDLEKYQVYIREIFHANAVPEEVFNKVLDQCVIYALNNRKRAVGGTISQDEFAPFTKGVFDQYGFSSSHRTARKNYKLLYEIEDSKIIPRNNSEIVAFVTINEQDFYIERTRMVKEKISIKLRSRQNNTIIADLLLEVTCKWYRQFGRLQMLPLAGKEATIKIESIEMGYNESDYIYPLTIYAVMEAINKCQFDVIFEAKKLDGKLSRPIAESLIKLGGKVEKNKIHLSLGMIENRF